LDIKVRGFDFDLLLGAYVVNPSFASNSLSTLADNFMKTTLAFDETIIGKKGKTQTDLNIIANHSLEKCRVIRKLEPKLLEKMKENNQMSLFQDIEIPLAFILGDIELNGFKIDRNELIRIGTEFNRKVEELGQQIYSLCGETFNISSPLQLGKILFEKLNLPHGKKTKTGYSTSVDILEKLAPDYEVVRLVLEYRKFAKLSSTYITGLQLEMFQDSKVHTMFKQALTLTGRLSSVEPNIQNIPIRTEDGKIIRSAFVPSFEGGYIVSADYSQIELRLLAHMAKVPEMLKAFNNEADFHTLTAAKMYGIKPEEVTPTLRRSAKAVNFGIIYGMSDWGLSETLGINPAEANQFIKKYFEAYPEIRVFLDKTVQEAKENGYTKTLFERRRYIPELANSNYQLEQFGERTAMNAPLQGSAADVIKKAMIDVDRALKGANLKSKMVAQIHDELVLDVPAEELEQVKVLVEKAMEETVKLDVLLRADVEYGPNWNIK
jgi:DNA polymerase-1